MSYDFEWDLAKAVANRRKHGVSFREAATAFLDPRMLTLYDEEHSESEDRWITFGLSARGRLLAVCHTFGEEAGEWVTIRIFSSRKATENETRQYTE